MTPGQDFGDGVGHDPTPPGTAPAVVTCVMACHDRRELTLRCLASLRDQIPVAGLELRMLVVDDGSTDGTAAAIAAEHPDVDLVRGDGTWMWGGSMRRGIDVAIARGADALWLVNDDVEFHPEALVRLVDALDSNAARAASTVVPANPGPTGSGRWPSVWVVGATADPATGRTSYSGWARTHRWRPRVAMLAPGDRPVRCDFASFNCILVPATDYRRLGGIDRRFPHGYGDHDLSRRATRAGYPLVLVPGHVGWCAPNPQPVWTDPTAALGTRIRDLHSPRNRPPRQAWRFATRHYGAHAPLLFARPYARVVAGALTSGIRGRRSSGR